MLWILKGNVYAGGMRIYTAHGEIWDAVNATLFEEVRMIGSLPVIRVIHDGIFESASTFLVVV